MDRAKLRADLVRDEDMNLTSYLDTEGNWTIGIGHLLGKERRVLQITAAECDAWFEADVAVAIRVAQRYAPSLWGHDDEPRQRALVNMAFNLGHRLGKFEKFLAAVAVSDWNKAAEEMVDSVWAKQVGARAVRLRAMILGA